MTDHATTPQFLEPGEVYDPDKTYACVSHPEGHPGREGYMPPENLDDQGRYVPVTMCTTGEVDEHAYSGEEAPERDPEVQAAIEEAAPAQDAPQPLYAGTYAVYDDGKGGVVLVLAQSTGETAHRHIPAGLLKMAEKFGGGGLGALFGG